MLKKDGGTDGEAFITVSGWTRPGSDALCGKRLLTKEKEERTADLRMITTARSGPFSVYTVFLCCR